MIGYFNKLIQDARAGQATAEYIIIVALIAVAGIVVVTFFGNQIRNLFTHSTAKLAGQDDDEYTTDAEETAQGAIDERGKGVTLGEF